MSSWGFSNASASSSSTRVTLSPSPGFTVKSSTTDSAVYTLSTPDQSVQPPSTASSSKNLLEPTTPKSPVLLIPKGIKTFLNIAWDKNVPAPPPASEDAIRRAMMGEDIEAALTENGKDGVYIVPVIVSEPREDKDKSGNPSIVFDCIFNSSLKSRATKDPEYRTYLIELALEHVEEKAKITLSRQISTPKIASKGKLDPRTVLIPNSLLSSGPASSTAARKILVEELPASTKGSVKGKEKEVHQPKSILRSKPSQSSVTNGKSATKPLIEELGDPLDNSSHEKIKLGQVPRWRWAKDGDRIVITIEVPRLTHAMHSSSTLDVETRRVLFDILGIYTLDIDLSLPDSEIGKIHSDVGNRGPGISSSDMEALKIKGHNAGEALRLKRSRDFDVENARAEWRVAEGHVVLWV
ncbi:hypothetical protein BD410DRAFT_782854 [Rickenella mellea]|uniref:PIH1 N-terminal domain-containing protein n=1 Tax=Rickenella mellea TaxID=50990 RepID=A0A4Y7QGH8_9AGAM|nr:hypothetical protein BD410DRAFT_782854 [Rickenella mellea]